VIDARAVVAADEPAGIATAIRIESETETSEDDACG
jgi:hypothetical protein